MKLCDCLKRVKSLRFFELPTDSVVNVLRHAGLDISGDSEVTKVGTREGHDYIQVDTGEGTLVLWPEYKEESDKCQEASTK